MPPVVSVVLVKVIAWLGCTHKLNVSAVACGFGKLYKLIVTWSVTEGEHPSFSVTVYVVAVDGVTVGFCAVVLLMLLLGDQLYVYGPPFPPDGVAPIATLEPGHIVSSALAVIVNTGCTVTVTLFVFDVHPLPSTADTV